MSGPDRVAPRLGEVGEGPSGYRSKKSSNSATLSLSLMEFQKASSSSAPRAGRRQRRTLDVLRASGDRRDRFLRRRFADPHLEGTDGLGNVLHLLLAQILEGDQPMLAHMIAHAARHAYASGSASDSSRAAMLTPSPKMSPSLTMTSPTLMPIRNSMRRSGGSLAFSCGSASCDFTAQSTAATTLPNSARTLSPAVPVIRPPWRADQGVDDQAMGRERGERRWLVALHVPAVAFDIRRKDRNELALEMGCFHSNAFNPEFRAQAGWPGWAVPELPSCVTLPLSIGFKSVRIQGSRSRGSNETLATIMGIGRWVAKGDQTRSHLTLNARASER